MRKLILILLSLFILSCNDPVFYAVSMEELPLDPRIAGPSTNFTGLDGKMYVAARSKIYIYNGGSETEKGTWSDFLPPGNERILQLAATDDRLYVSLVTNKIISFTSAMEQDKEITLEDGRVIDGIFAVNNILFVGARKDRSYSAYYTNDGSTFTEITAGSGQFSMLCGVTCDADYYYLCFKDSAGIYVVSKQAPGAAVLIPSSAEKNFTGIINLENTANTIMAISRSGILYNVSPAGISEAAKFNNRVATSAFGIWTNGAWTDGVWTKGAGKLLLAGRQDLSNSTTTGYTHGYVEISVNDAGITPGSNFNEPGRVTPSSISANTNEHYISSIGKHGINYFFQASDGILFASTNHGIWSYRKRSEDKYSWNAEE
jgi:hypothetical protein